MSWIKLCAWNAPIGYYLPPMVRRLVANATRWMLAMRLSCNLLGRCFSKSNRFRDSENSKTFTDYHHSKCDMKLHPVNNRAKLGVALPGHLLLFCLERPEWTAKDKVTCSSGLSVGGKKCVLASSVYITDWFFDGPG
jgi:hypothetical protein